VLAHYEAEIAKCSDGTPGSIAGPLLNTANKLRLLQEDFRAKVSPAVSAVKELYHHLLDTLQREPGTCIRVGGDSPAYLRLTDRVTKGIQVDAVMAHRMFEFTTDEFCEDAQEVMRTRAAALAKWRAAHSGGGGGGTPAETSGRGRGRGGRGGGRGSGGGRGGAAGAAGAAGVDVGGAMRDAPQTYVSRGNQAAALARAAWESVDVLNTPCVTADAAHKDAAVMEAMDIMDEVLRTSRRKAEEEEGGGGSGGGASGGASGVAVPPCTLVPDDLDPVNPPGHVPLRDGPLTVFEMFCEVARLRAKRLHCPHRAVMVKAKRPPPGMAIKDAGTELTEAASRWQELQQMVTTGRAANRTARAPHLIATSVCHKNLMDMLKDKGPAYVFRAPLEPVDGTDYHVAISLRPKERMLTPLSLGVLTNIVHRVAEVHIKSQSFGRELFDPARHAAAVVGRPTVTVLADVAEALAEFYRTNTTIDYVVQCKRVVGPAPNAALLASGHGHGGDGFDCSDDDDDEDDDADDYSDAE
jgi:hypothetical protein